MSTEVLGESVGCATRTLFVSSSLQLAIARLEMSSQEQFLNGTTASYVEEMYNAWRMDPKSVHASWNAFFRRSSSGMSPGDAYQPPPDLAADPTNRNIVLSKISPIQEATSTSRASSTDIANQMAVMSIIRAYQMRGHLLAELDPLGISYGHKAAGDRGSGALSTATVLRQHRIPAKTESDWETQYTLPDSSFIGGSERSLSLREIINRLESSYCHHIGAEFMHINDLDIVQWIRERMETPNLRYTYNKEEKQRLLKRLIRAGGFENFLAKKWPGEKRFGLEGLEVLIPTMKQVIDRASALGCGTFIIGMAHRGRLNVIANVCRKPLVQIFSQFHGLELEDTGSADVKYHLGTKMTIKNRVTGKETTICVLANPSHLEVISALVQGRTRAEQFYQGDVDGKKVLSIHVHGDAAFCGEGIVFETINMSNLPCYTTQGAIHIVTNNQVGFTTDPRSSRSSPYCTDVGRVVNAPIFHVNSDDPEAVMYVVDMAVEYRFRFGGDVVIDIVGYRRFGHNETDEPSFTQPRMYQRIRQLPPVQELYAKQLMDAKVVDQAWVDQYINQYATICEKDFNEGKNITTGKLTDWLDAIWKGFFKESEIMNKDQANCPPTGIPDAVMEKVGATVSSPPPGDFNTHPGIQRILKARVKMISSREADWALGEAFAYGSLLLDGVHVRLSGQDVERGTFSHRHHVLHDQKRDMVTYNPMQNLSADQAVYTVCNSSLSEFGVLGFEVGYSMTNPHALVIWEAQFGDFNNVAQCIHDQFLCSGESKWVRQCGVVLMLPHGLEGMGPEHSSARPERFLQLCDDDPDTQTMPDEESPQRAAVKQLANINWIVANTTTPANFFHILRRQIALPFRKPLILMTPKSLLRHEEARSSFSDMGEGTEFQRLIPDDGPCTGGPQSVEKLILCSGKVFYEIRQAVRAAGHDSRISVARIEQLCPFPYDLVATEKNKYPNAKIVWVQEEHKNQGAWAYVCPRIRACTGSEPVYIGRLASSAPSTGNKILFKRELEAFMSEATSLVSVNKE